MKKLQILMVIGGLIFSSHLAYAEVIELNSGEIVNGSITTLTDELIEVNLTSGDLAVYNLEEIKTINDTPLAAYTKPVISPPLYVHQEKEFFNFDMSHFDSTDLSFVKGYFSIVGIVISLIIYFILCFPLMKIALRLKLNRIAWWAWIPILNIFILPKLAGKSLLWVFLLIVPIINVIVGVYFWVCIAQRLGQPGALGVLSIFPGLNIFLFWYLALFKQTIDEQTKNQATSRSTPPPSTSPQTTTDKESMLKNNILGSSYDNKETPEELKGDQ